jgi:anti-anti-sigma factor
MEHVTGHLELTEHGHGPELHLIGEFDLANAETLRLCLAELVLQGKRSAVIDMARADFIDSSTIGALVAAHQSGLAITVRAPSAQVRRALEVAGIADALNIEN